MKKRDFRILAVIAAVILLVCLLWYGRFSAGSSGGLAVRVTRGDKEIGTYDLSDDQEIEIPDENGNVTNVAIIHDGSVSMKKANCPDHLCIREGRIDSAGESIICLPNRVVVSVYDPSGSQDSYDVIAQ